MVVVANIVGIDAEPPAGSQSAVRLALNIGSAPMSSTFLCYLHKPDAETPELRVVTCEGNDDLPDIILQEMRTWPVVDLIEVYDEQDHRLLRVAADGARTH